MLVLLASKRLFLFYNLLFGYENRVVRYEIILDSVETLVDTAGNPAYWIALVIVE